MGLHKGPGNSCSLLSSQERSKEALGLRPTIYTGDLIPRPLPGPSGPYPAGLIAYTSLHKISSSILLISSWGLGPKHYPAELDRKLGRIGGNSFLFKVSGIPAGGDRCPRKGLR